MSVTSARSATWHALGGVTASKATLWATHALVDLTRTGTWHVRSAVLGQRATTWDVASDIIPPSAAPGQTYTVPVELRVLTVVRDPRTRVVGAEPRTATV